MARVVAQLETAGWQDKDLESAQPGSAQPAEFPPPRGISTEAERKRFVREAVPSWRGLPDSVEITLTKFAAGTHSVVMKAQIGGPGSQAVTPTAVVYRRETR